MTVFDVIEKIDTIDTIVKRLRGEIDYMPLTDECKADTADLLDEYRDMLVNMKISGYKG